MQPLEQATDEALAAIEWLAFDVDDTITDHGVLASRSLATMEALRSVGVKLAAVTGRPLGWAEVWMAQWPIDLAIGENGAGWFVRDGCAIRARLILDDPSGVSAARERAYAIGRAVAPAIPVPPDGPARRVDVAFDIAETRRATDAEVEALDSALRAGGFRTVRSTIHLHAACAAWDKAAGLAAALAAEAGLVLDESLDRVAFVGDSPNDEPLFARLPLSFGVANVGDHPLSHRPRFVTHGRGSFGFAELGARIVTSKGGA